MITAELVEHIAKLARIALSEEEKLIYRSQMAEIIDYFDELAAIDTAGVEPMAHPLPINNVMREDEIQPSSGHEVLLKNAPAREGSFFCVPKI